VSRARQQPVLTPTTSRIRPTVHNAAAARLDDGRTVLLSGPPPNGGPSGYADSSDGEHFVVRPTVPDAGTESRLPLRRFGVEDPRLTRPTTVPVLALQRSPPWRRIGLAHHRFSRSSERLHPMNPNHATRSVPRADRRRLRRLDRPHTELTLGPSAVPIARPRPLGEANG